MIHTRTRLAVLPTILLAALASAERLPATFNHPDKNLLSLIVFPELRSDTSATLRCVSQVSSSGKMKENGCYVNTAGDEVYIKAIVAAAKRARMTPARVDGKAISVYVQYQLEFTKKGEEQTIRIMNNPGLEENVEAYGDEHIAAQRGLTTEKWLKICPQQVHYNVWAKAHVAADGKQSSISISPGD
ncbi:MAG: hypothetical protein KDI09_13915, partial [Halioglobus sp.]|nr:hypothetical protein [Halioglobus sp.]